MKRLEKRGELAPLTREEAFAVHVYTQDSWFYKEVNRRLRLRERQSLKPFFPYLKLFLTGLHRLEPVDDTVYRGVKLDLAAKYGVDDDIVWWAFSSATATAGVLTSDEFLGETGPRTLFSIKVHRCVNIRRYSAMGGEDERLILPGTAFHVKSHLPLGAELTMIQLEVCVCVCVCVCVVHVCQTHCVRSCACVRVRHARARAQGMTHVYA